MHLILQLYKPQRFLKYHKYQIVKIKQFLSYTNFNEIYSYIL